MGGWARCPEAVPALRFGGALTFFPSPFLGVLSIETHSDHSGRQGVIPLTWSWQLTQLTQGHPAPLRGAVEMKTSGLCSWRWRPEGACGGLVSVAGP